MVYSNWHYQRKLNVERYGSCRYISNNVLKELSMLILRHIKVSSAKIIEIGVGNGRVFIPLIKESKDKAKNVVFYGLDDSELMLNSLNNNLKENNIENKPNLIKADIQNPLALTPGNFLVVYSFATLHIVKDWKMAIDNILKLLAPKGYFIYVKEINQVFHSTENVIDKKDSPDLKSIRLNGNVKEFFEEYHRLRKKYGVPFDQQGILYSNPKKMVGYLKNKRMKYKVIRSKKLEWKKPHSFRELINALKDATITTFGSDIENPLRTKISQELLKFCKKRKFPLDCKFSVPSRLELYVFSSENCNG